MIFGFFSSMIPYIVAAGIYMIYLLLSLLQPSIETIADENLNAELKIVSPPDFADSSEPDKLYDFNDANNITDKYTFNSGAPFFFEFQDPYRNTLSKSPPEYRIPRQFEYSVKILSDIFFRPPPVC